MNIIDRKCTFWRYAISEIHIATFLLKNLGILSHQSFRLEADLRCTTA